LSTMTFIELFLAFV